LCGQEILFPHRKNLVQPTNDDSDQVAVSVVKLGDAENALMDPELMLEEVDDEVMNVEQPVDISGNDVASSEKGLSVSLPVKSNKKLDKIIANNTTITV